jgi:hypothetical protein
MRAMSSPHNWGVPICWMGHLDSADRAKTEFAQVKRAEYLWMHDSWKNPYGGAGRTVMPDTILDFGLNGDATAYHPYWRNPYVAGADPNLLVSIWRLADRDDPGMVAEAGTGRVDRVLVGVFNYDRAREQQATLKIDLGALGLSAPDAEVVARDLYGPEPGMDGYYRGGGGNHAVSGLSNTATRLDVTSGTLALAPLAPHRGRFVGLRLERRAETRRVLEALKSVAAEAGAPEPADLPEAALIWGATEPGAAFSGLGKAPAIVGTDPTVRAAAWAWRDRVLLAVVNTGDKPLDAVLKLDLTALNLTPRLPWQEFARLRDFTSEPPGGKAAPAVLDFHGGTLTIKAFAPRTVRLIGLRRY